MRNSFYVYFTFSFFVVCFCCCCFGTIYATFCYSPLSLLPPITPPHRKHINREVGGGEINFPSDFSDIHRLNYQDKVWSSVKISRDIFSMLFFLCFYATAQNNNNKRQIAAAKSINFLLFIITKATTKKTTSFSPFSPCH